MAERESVPKRRSLAFLNDLPEVTPPQFWEYSAGKVLAWSEYGDPSGFPVFYYHGWPSSRLQARLAHHLAVKRGLRIISMDRPGMGKSSFMPGRVLSDWSGMMEGFADHLSIEKFAQLGVSGGGPYVLMCAAKIPDRLAASAVLAGMVPLPMLECGISGLHPMYRMLIPLRKLPAPVFTAGFWASSFASKADPLQFPMSLFLRSFAEEDRAILHENRNVWKVTTASYNEGVCGAAGGQGVLADAEIYLLNPDLDPGKITHPIAYWHGDEDKNIPAEFVQELTANMPSSCLEIAPGLGHFSLAVHRAEDALNFIRERV